MEIKSEYQNHAVEFVDFTVEKILKIGVPPNEETLSISINDDVQVDGNDIQVILNLRINDEKDIFVLELSMRGFFKVEAEYVEGFKPNLLAIMFPYLRSAASFITSIDGKAPIILPPINFVEYSNHVKTNVE